MSFEQPEVRRATLDDLDGLMRINADSPFGHDEAVHEREIDTTLVVCQQGLVVAYSMLGEFCWPDSNRDPFLRTVNVSLEHRGQGLGTLAVEGAAWLASVGFDEHHEPADGLISSTDVTNTASQAFHLKLGFQFIGTLRLRDQDRPENYYVRDLRTHPAKEGARPIS